MDRSRPVFVLSTGRCGSLALERLLRRSRETEPFHRPRVLLSRGRFSRYRNDLTIVLEQNFTHYHVTVADEPAPWRRSYALWSLRRSRRRLIDRVQRDGRIFVELNHGFAGFSPLLPEVFPDAVFVHLVRHPSDVVASFMRKFDPPPMALPAYVGPRYGVRAAWVFRHGRIRSLSDRAPRPVRRFVAEHRYDRHLHPFERVGSELRERTDLDPFEKTCWYWNEINRLAADLTDELGPARALRVRFEDLFHPDASDAQRELLRFMGVSDLDPDAEPLLREPVNPKEVLTEFPVARDWSPEMNETLVRLCGATMARLAYSPDELAVAATPR